MADDLQTVREAVLTRLGDTDNVIWSDAEVEGYLKEGYNILCERTRVLWTRSALNDVKGQATYTLPADLYQIERASWDGRLLKAWTARQAEAFDYQYETNTGTVVAYVLEKDGLRILRKVRVPDASSDLTVSGDFGIPESYAELGGATGDFGIPVSWSGVVVSGTFGIPEAYEDMTANTVIEYTRRGKAVSAATDEFELPPYSVKYLRCYALARCLSRESPGQDLKLAAHFEMRFKGEIERFREIRRRFHRRMVSRFGAPDMKYRYKDQEIPWSHRSVTKS